MATTRVFPGTFPLSYKTELLKAIETVDLERVNQAIEILDRGDFYLAGHRLIFEQMLSLVTC